MGKAQTIPFFGTSREFAAHRDPIMERIEKVLASGQALQGPEITALEKMCAEQAGRQYGVACGSCTDALFFSLMACGLAPGDEVLVTDFSFIASASCIVRSGATPVFVDIDSTYNMDFDLATKLIGPKTKALIHVHLFGQMSNPERVENFCRQHNLHLIEDSAQSFGAYYAGRAAGSMGDISCISFDPTKPQSAPGSGGMALTDNLQHAQKMRALRYHGRDEKRRFTTLGYNSQMPALTAAVLQYKLSYDPAGRQRRRDIAEYYIDRLQSTGVILPAPPPEADHIYHKFVLRTPKRDMLRQTLIDADIQVMVHYATPLHRHPVFTNLGYRDQSFPQATLCSNTALSLPIHPYLRDDEVEKVVEAVTDFFT